MKMHQLIQKVIEDNYCEWGMFLENVPDIHELRRQVRTAKTKDDLQAVINQYI